MTAHRIAGLALAILLAGCGKPPVEDLSDSQEAAEPVAAPAPSEVATPKTDPRTRIDPYVFEPYAKSGYPKLAAKLGRSWSRIQALREAAAVKAIETNNCDHVELAEVSDARTTRENITVFVDCRNRERFYVSEADVAASSNPVAQSARTVGRSQAIEACAEAARRAATYPSLVDAHTWAGASFTSDRTTGGARVLLDFEATNAFGDELPYRANCLFPTDAAPELSITAR